MTDRVNKPRIRYDREEMIELLSRRTSHTVLRVMAIVDEYEKTRAEGKDKPCQSRVWHGPGHQSSTFCQQRGEHDEHYAQLLSGGYAEWTDKDPYYRAW